MNLTNAIAELNEISVIFREIQIRRNYLINYIDDERAFERRRNIENKKRIVISNKVKTLKKNEVNNDMTNCCGICLNTHKKIESIICSCSHEYGKECFQQWAINCKNNNKKINCPTCRSDTTQIISFRERNKKTKSNVIIQPTVIVHSSEQIVQIQAVPNPINNLV